MVRITNLAEQPFNTNYTLYPVNTEGLTLYNNSVLFQQGGQNYFEYKVTDFDLLDAGTYYLSVTTGYDHCESFVIEKTVLLKPDPSPCQNELKRNTLFVSDSFVGETSFIDYSPQLYTDGTGLHIQLEDGPFSDFACVLDFDTDYSKLSTNYVGLSGHGYSVTSFDYDPRLYCNIRFYQSGFATNNFKLENFEHKVYVVKQEDKLIISFCNAKFYGEGGVLRYVSTVMEVYL